MPHQVTKKQHFVPVFYLENFCISHKLYLYDVKQKAYSSCNPKSIFYKNNLYETKNKSAHPALGKYILENQLEHDLSKNEGNYSGVLKNVISLLANSREDHILLSPESKETLCDFTINMLVRNPWFMNEFLSDPEILKNHIPELQEYDRLLHEMGLGNIDSLIAHADKAICIKQDSPGGLHQVLKKSLSELALSFFIATDNQFLTSNSPVLYETYDSENGLTYIKNVILPISPSFALYYHYKNDPHPEVCQLDRTAVTKINRNYLRLPDKILRFLVAQNKEVIESTLIQF